MRSKKTIYNILTNLILQLLILINGFIIPKIIINSFGSDVNGLVASITQFLSYITLLESGFGPVVKSILYKPIAKNDKLEITNILKTSEKFFRRISFIFLVYIGILAIVYPQFVNSEFGYLYTVSLILIISISIFAEYYFGITYRLYLQAEQKTYVISIIQIITYILSIIIVIFLAKLNASIHLIKLVSGLIFTIRPLIQNLYIKQHYSINLKKSPGNYYIKNKWDGLVQHIAAVIHNNTDITILTFCSTLAEVSVYSVYCLVVKGVKSLIQAFVSGIDSSFGDMIARNERENLNKKFNMYEVLYNTISTICYSCTILLITPFVSVYTKGITDADYIRYAFGYLIVISEYIWAIRLPYSSITLAAGHFKETKLGAWLECFSNIIISILLVFKYGIIGVAIGTIVAMVIRTMEFIYHSNKYILKRSILISVKKIVLVIVETLIVVFACRYLPYLSNDNYLHWIINSIMVFTVSSFITLLINYIIYKDEFKGAINLFINFLKKSSN